MKEIAIANSPKEQTKYPYNRCVSTPGRKNNPKTETKKAGNSQNRWKHVQWTRTNIHQPTKSRNPQKNRPCERGTLAKEVHNGNIQKKKTKTEAPFEMYL